MYDQVLAGLKKAYGSILTRIGDPLDDGTLYGTYMFLQIKTEFVYTFCLLFFFYYSIKVQCIAKLALKDIKSLLRKL